MEKYNELNKCKKCGGGAKTRYVDLQIAKIEVRPHMMDKIERVCNRCGYIWFEEPMDEFEESTEESGIEETDLDIKHEKIIEDETEEDDYQMTEKGPGI